MLLDKLIHHLSRTHSLGLRGFTFLNSQRVLGSPEITLWMRISEHNSGSGISLC